MRLRVAILLLVGLAVVLAAPAQKKKSKDEASTQALPLLKEPPGAVEAETGRLVFQVSPLSNKGLLSQQARDALKVLLHDARGATIVKLRAFVAGSGDMRRVSSIVSETFTDHHLALPALSTIEVGALPMEGAQVVIESIAEEKKVVNPYGVAFYSGQPVAQLHPIAGALRATCFLSSLDDLAAVKSKIASALPGAVLNFVQSQRLGFEPQDVCEAVARLDAAPSPSVNVTNGVAAINAPKIVLTGTQMAFRDTDADLRLAFERLSKSLEAFGATDAEVFWSGTYTLTRPMEQKVQTVEKEFFKSPAGTTLLFEGLPSLDATMAVEVFAAK